MSEKGRFVHPSVSDWIEERGWRTRTKNELSAFSRRKVLQGARWEDEGFQFAPFSARDSLPRVPSCVPWNFIKMIDITVFRVRLIIIHRVRIMASLLVPLSSFLLSILSFFTRCRSRGTIQRTAKYTSRVIRPFRFAVRTRVE